MTLQEVKEYLKIDYEDEDLLLNNLIIVADDYILSATGKAHKKSPKADLIRKLLIHEWYKDRSLIEDKDAGKVRYIVSSIMLQLKFENEVI